MKVVVDLNLCQGYAPCCYEAPNAFKLKGAEFLSTIMRLINDCVVRSSGLHRLVRFNPELSERDLEIVRLIATGKTNQEIATTLSVAESTVKFHVTRILSKLGTSDHIQVVIIVLRRGITKLF
ncbi:MAG: LuxR C-terminal-related transcriptional regulator [Rhizonema sp. PD37]|nr:LuxR C-terminal-related transcriptional regulator [Rhizonema sp. PD37]